jgi:1-acyl-sn-glycerol-3-phosphate acyltransferase
VHGWEHIPPSPVLFVSNHSGGTLIPDVWGFLYSWYRHFGTRRPLHPLAHDMLFATRSIGRFFSERGVVRAHKADGLEVLRDWKRDLIVYPGGDRDTWRPFSHRFQISFAGRKGYARLALEAGVPIVPVAHAGAHETLIVLRSGRRIAKALKFPQLFRAEIMPVHISIPWGLTVGPWPHIPLPTRFRYRIGPPVVLPSHDGVISQALVDEVDARVRSALQAELTELEFASEKRQEAPRPRRVVRREPRVAEPSDRPFAPPPAV